MRAKAFLCIPLLLILFSATGQSDTIPLPPWQHVMLDNAGRIYLADRNGQVFRQSGDDTSTRLIYSPVKKVRISLMDITNPLRTFLFS